MQTITSRSISPHDTAIVSICQVHGGEADNVIPSSVVLSGTVRDFLPAVSQTIPALVSCRSLGILFNIDGIVENISASFGVEGKLDFHDFFPAVVNHAHATKTAFSVSMAKVSEEGLPICGAEDFAYYLEQRPGCFFFVGTKHKDDAQNRNCHSDAYDFNDAITPLAIRMFLNILNKRFQSALYTPEELVQRVFWNKPKPRSLYTLLLSAKRFYPFFVLNFKNNGEIKARTHTSSLVRPHYSTRHN
ncbi:unnamed protein product [Aphanomyces euteiches]